MRPNPRLLVEYQESSSIAQRQQISAQCVMTRAANTESVCALLLLEVEVDGFYFSRCCLNRNTVLECRWCEFRSNYGVTCEEEAKRRNSRA
ncbi:hypothetical protein Tco_0213160 [Tanacetum coccineum]